MAGCFTSGSLTQLRSLGFEIVYIEYEDLTDDFSKLGIDIHFDEDTPTEWFSQRLAQIIAGGSQLERDLVKQIRSTNRSQFDSFFSKLTDKLKRYIDRLVVIPLFGDEVSFSQLSEALEFLSGYDAAAGGGAFRAFEVIVKYSNGDRLEGSFESAKEAERFLRYAAS